MSSGPRQVMSGVLLALVAVGPAVSAAVAQEATPSPAAHPPIVVTRDRAEPAACGPREAATLVARFFDAFNRGDLDHAMTFFGPDFKWFGVGADDEWDGVSDFFAYDPASGFASAGPDAATGSAAETLPPYFGERHGHGEHWRLVDLAVNPEPGEEISSLFFHVERRADDLPPGADGRRHRYVGKGQVDCAKGTIILWSMNPARPGSGDDLPACPDPPAGTSPDAIVACGPPASARGPAPADGSPS